MKNNNQMLPQGWKRRRLGDLAEFRNGLNYVSGTKGHPVKIIGVADFQQHTVGPNGPLETVYVPRPIQNNELLKDGDLLFVRSNGNKSLIGRCLFIKDVREPISHSGFTIKARITDPDIDPEYISLYMRSELVRKQILMAGGGTNISNLSQEILSNLELPIAPPADRVVLVRLFNAWEIGAKATEALLVTKEKFKRALMQQLLSGKRRFKEFTKEKWRQCKLGNILFEVNRPIIWDDNALYDLISVRRRSGGIFRREKLYGHQILAKDLCKVKAGDFLISKRQVVHGAWGLVAKEFDESFVSGSYAALRSKNEDELDMEYFNYLSRIPKMYRLAYLSSYGVHIEKMIFFTRLFLKERVRIPPTIKEQRKIVDVLRTADDEIELLRHQLEKLKLQKKGLMQQLLTGKVRVKP